MRRLFAIHSFGCKVNQEEGRELAALFTARGWQEVPLAQEADLYLVNGCAVTAEAERKARQLIKRLAREHPQARIAVCGCFAQVTDLSWDTLPQVIAVAGVDQRRLLPDLVAQALSTQDQPLQIALVPSSEASRFQMISQRHQSPRQRAYLKIEDGCGEYCHYCIVPYARGPVRSLPPQQVCAQVEDLLAQGHQEIVLSGIHIGAYGSDLSGQGDLVALLQRLCALPALRRLRLGSIEPQQFSPALIALLTQEQKICPQLHIPLQSGAEHTLQAMGRKYTAVAYRSLVQRLQALRPELAITTDLMVGYPGESEADFAESLAFCREIGFLRMHIFPYSRRPGTVAARLPGQCSQAVKQARARQAGDLAQALAAAYAARYVGQPVQLLLEQIENWQGTDYWRGYSEHYIPLLLPVAAGQWQAGEIVPCVGERVAGEQLVVRPLLSV